MIYRALLPAALVLSLGAAPAAPSHFGASSAPAMSVHAGLAGAARPGRWLPVDVALTAGDSAFHGYVSVEWGGAVARRDIDVPPSSTTRATILIRTIAATPFVRVALVDAEGRVVTSARTDMALLPMDEPVTLCIGTAAENIACTLRIAAIDAPTNWRAFDIADSVIGDAGGSPRPESARALAVAHAARWWHNSGFVDPVVTPFDTRSVVSSRSTVRLMLIAAVLLLFTGAAAWRRAGIVMLTVVPVLITAGGAVFVARNTEDVGVQAAAFVHQFSGVPQSLLSIRGEVEHPSTRSIELEPDVDDATIETLHGLDHSESVASAAGRAVYRRIAGRGARQRFELEGAHNAQWVSVDLTGPDMLVRNLSTGTLSDCHFRSTEREAIGAIAAGASVRVALSAPPSPGDSIVCGLPPGWLSWSSSGSAAAMRGSAFLVFHFWPGPVEPGNHAAR
jgi:hypothetical protein